MSRVAGGNQQKHCAALHSTLGESEKEDPRLPDFLLWMQRTAAEICKQTRNSTKASWNMLSWEHRTRQRASAATQLNVQDRHASAAFSLSKHQSQARKGMDLCQYRRSDKLRHQHLLTAERQSARR